MCVVFEIYHILVENSFILIPYCMHLNAFLLCTVNFLSIRLR